MSDVVSSNQSAITMLNGRAQVICDYIREVKEGKESLYLNYFSDILIIYYNKITIYCGVWGKAR